MSHVTIHADAPTHLLVTVLQAMLLTGPTSVAADERGSHLTLIDTPSNYHPPPVEPVVQRPPTPDLAPQAKTTRRKGTVSFQDRVLDTLVRFGSPMDAPSLAAELGRGVTPKQVSTNLSHLVHRGVVERAGRGVYRIPDPITRSSFDPDAARNAAADALAGGEGL